MATSDAAAAPADTPRRVTGALSSLFAAWGSAGELVGSTEAQLRKRQRLGLGSVLTSLAGLAISLLGLLADKGAVKSLTTLAGAAQALWRGELKGPAVVVLAGFVLFAGGAVLYVLLRWTRFLQAETREPFRYTVSLDEFKRTAKEAPACTLAAEGRMALLNHDLRERLHLRIDRFSLLDAPPAAEAGAQPAHLHVAGQYALRQDRRGHWNLQVMPTVRLGSASAPVAMAYTVMFPLGKDPKELTAPQYEQLVERVYSSIATEIYRTIEADVRTKIRRFPTAYLRAVALYYEAHDISRSNTVDAYDLALTLYRDARQAFEMAPGRAAWRAWTRWPLIQPQALRYVQMRARVHIGDVRCQVYRHMTALQTGRRPNPIYACVPRLKEVIADLQWMHEELSESGEPFGPEMAAGAYFRFPVDRFARRLQRRPSEAAFADLRRCLFDAHTVSALVNSQLGANLRARQDLALAAAVDPGLAAADPVHLVAQAQIEPRPRQRARLLRLAADLAPKFQLAQFQLARTVELAFREEGGVTAAAPGAGGRVDNVLRHYDDVLRLNPGNLAAIAAQGYLHWLTGDLAAAEQCFRDGLAFKAIVRDTATPELNYGLARVLAERGDDDEAFDQYLQAMAAERDVAAWSNSVASLTGIYYVFVDDALVERYGRLRDGVAQRLKKADGAEVVRKTVLSFVCNDHANALLNSYFRNGRRDHLERSFKALEAALKAAPSNPVAHFNSAQAHEFKARVDPKHEIRLAVRSIEKAAELAPHWLTARTRQAELTLSPTTFDRLDSDLEAAEADLQAARAPLAPPPKSASLPVGSAAGQLEAQLARSRRIEQAEDRLRELQHERTNLLHGRLDERLKDVIDALTQDLRPRILTQPTAGAAEDEGDEAQRWCDNCLRLLQDRRTRWDQLDSGDVAALTGIVNATVPRTFGRLRRTRTLLKHLAEDDPQRPPLEAVEQRCVAELTRDLAFIDVLVERFGSVDLNLHINSYDVIGELGLPPRPEIDRFIAEAVKAWTHEDPWHFWLLSSWILWLDPAETRRLGETLLRGSGDVLRLRLVARRLFDLGRESAGETDALRYGCLRELAQRCLELDDKDDFSRCLHGVALDAAGNATGALRELKRAFESARNAAAPPDDELAALVASPTVGAAWRHAAVQRFVDLRSDDDVAGAMGIVDDALALGRCDAELLEHVLGLAESQPTRGERRALAARALALLRAHDPAGAHAEAATRLRALHIYDLRERRRLHAVVPLVVDVAPDVESLIVDERLELLASVDEAIEHMRAAVQAASGVRPPPVRFRPGTGFADGQFVVSIDEIPVVGARTHVGATFWLGDAGTVWAHEATDPLSGRRGGWLAADETPPDGARALCDALGFLLRTLEQVVSEHLSSLFFHDEKLMQRLALPADADGETAFVGALRGLLMENVPVLRPEALAQGWADAAEEGAAARAELLRKLPVVMPVLPGNDGAHRLLMPGPRFLERIRSGLVGAPEPVLALEPSSCQELLAAVREAQRADDMPAALLVASPALRPHVAALTRIEFPRLPVLGVDELSAPPAAPVEVEVPA